MPSDPTYHPAMTRGLLWVVELRFQQDGWFRANNTLLGDWLRGLPFWSAFTHIEPSGKRAQSLTAASFEKALADERSAGFWLEAGPDGGDVRLRLTREPVTLTLQVTLESDRMAAHAAGLEDVTRTLVESFGDGVVLPMSGLRPRYDPDLPWTKVPGRPPAPYLAYENVVDIFDRRQSSVFANAEANDVVAHLLAASCPPGVRRVDHQNATLMFWTEQLTDDAALAEARMRHERYLVDAVRAVRGTSP